MNFIILNKKRYTIVPAVCLLVSSGVMRIAPGGGALKVGCRAEGEPPPGKGARRSARSKKTLIQYIVPGVPV